MIFVRTKSNFFVLLLMLMIDHDDDDRLQTVVLVARNMIKSSNFAKYHHSMRDNERSRKIGWFCESCKRPIRSVLERYLFMRSASTIHLSVYLMDRHNFATTTTSQNRIVVSTTMSQQGNNTGGGGGGRGTINYDINKPTHSLTVSGTTEFDDELLRRQIVTPHQVFLAKGATPLEAHRLATEWTQQKQQQPQQQKEEERHNSDISNSKKVNDNDDDKDDDESFLDDDDDDEEDRLFIERYRQERLAELQKQQHHQPSLSSATTMTGATHGTTINHISRQEWTSRVNYPSHHCWVVVCLTEKQHNGACNGDSGGDSNSSRYHDRVVEELHRISREFDKQSNDNEYYDSGGTTDMKLLTIYYRDAIPNWPTDHVPAMFAYRHGIKQHEWIASTRGEFPSRDLLEVLFRQWKIITG
jgi:hypothetical protein